MKGKEWLFVVVKFLLAGLAAIAADGSLGSPVQSGFTALLRSAEPSSALGAGLYVQPVPLALCVSCWKQPEARLSVKDSPLG